MAKVRFKGSEPADVPLLGRIVEPDEVVEIPDEWLAKPIKDEDKDSPTYGEVIGHEGYAWPEENWTEVSTKQKTSSKDGE